MIKEWYHSRKNGQRFLTIGEIAEACCIANQEVKAWFGDKIHKSEVTGPDLVDAADVVCFLVRNDLPVATSLLPPKTRKLLFITNEACACQDACDTFEQICRLLASTCNILVETATTGRFGDLSILTFSPNLVVIFIRACGQETINTLSLLSNFPEQQVLLFVDDSIKNNVEDTLERLSVHSHLISNGLPVEQLITQLRWVLQN